VLPGANWLAVKSGATGAASASAPGHVAFAIDPVAAAALTAGSYYGTIRVTAPGLADSPQDFQVILTAAPAGSNASYPDPTPAGLLFTALGTTAAQSQAVQVYANTTATVQYQTAANALTTANGISWLSVGPVSGNISSGSPGTSTVSVNPAGLPPGVYRGEVNYAYSVFGVRTVNITLIVSSATGSAQTGSFSSVPAQAQVSPSAALACVPSQLVPAQVGPLANFAAVASWPTPLGIRLYNDCGAPVANGQLVATFSNGDPPLALSLVDNTSALYSGTWVPRGTGAQLTMGATATAPGYPTATLRISGQVRPNSAPTIVPNGVTDIFNPLIGGALAPGAVVQIFGNGFAAQEGIPGKLPLPTSVGSTSVLIGGIASPLFYVGPGQINAQVPFELSSGNQYQVIVNANGALTAPSPIQLDAAAAGILNAPSSQIYAQRPDGSFVSSDAPAKPGENLVFYALAMGVTDSSVVATGAGAPGLSAGDKLANALGGVTLTIGGTQAVVQFAGLTPGAVGLYQVNFQVPLNARAGNQELVLTQGGVVANKTLLPIQP
jgi:uncharacterized protein (TIGR03437 family)